MNRRLNLVSDAEKFLMELETFDAKPLSEMPAEEAREFLHAVQRKYPQNINAEVTDRKVICRNDAEVEIRIVRPENSSNEKLPAIIYAHGGGWVMGDKEVYDTLIKKLAIMCHSSIIFVNYNRAPEFTYPGAIEEFCGVLEYVSKNYEEFNINPQKIVTAGDSAGGNIVIASTMKTLYENGSKIKAQILLYPVTSASMDTKSYEEFKNGPWLTKKSMEYFWDAYIPDKKTRKEVYASPLNADISEIKNFPPTLIITAENDVLRDEGEEFAIKLDHAGVCVSNMRVNGTIHDFMMLNALSDSVSTNAAFASVCGFLKRYLK